MPGRPKNERPGARPGRWVGRGHQQLEGRHPSGALDAGEERFEAEEGSGCGALPSSATREGGSRIIRAPPGLQVTRPRLEPQWRARAAPAPAINNSTHSQRAQIFGGAQVGEERSEKEHATQIHGGKCVDNRYSSQTEGGC